MQNNPYQAPSTEDLGTPAAKAWPIGGWLILFALGVVIAPFRIIVEAGVYAEIFSDGTFSMIMQEQPTAGYFIIGETICNLMIFSASLYLVYLLFTKKQRIINFYPAYVTVNVLFVTVDAIIGAQIFDIQAFDPETTKMLFGMIFWGVIWSAYLRNSERVEKTMVNVSEARDDGSPRI